MHPKTAKPSHDYKPTDVLHMTAGYNRESVDADPQTLADIGLCEDTLAGMTASEVEKVIVEEFERFVWDAVGDSCGWKVSKS